jgi:hypothetical protein
MNHPCSEGGGRPDDGGERGEPRLTARTNRRIDTPKRTAIGNTTSAKTIRAVRASARAPRFGNAGRSADRHCDRGTDADGCEAHQSRRMNMTSVLSQIDRALAGPSPATARHEEDGEGFRAHSFGRRHRKTLRRVCSSWRGCMSRPCPPSYRHAGIHLSRPYEVHHSRPTRARGSWRPESGASCRALHALRSRRTASTTSVGSSGTIRTIIRGTLRHRRSVAWESLVSGHRNAFCLPRPPQASRPGPIVWVIRRSAGVASRLQRPSSHAQPG